MWRRHSCRRVAEGTRRLLRTYNSLMTRTELLGRITIDPNVCFGKACIRGTRIWVALVIENLANGVSERELLDNYPSLVADDIRAALAYAAEITRERIIPSQIVAK